MTNFGKVRLFHEAFGHPVQDGPGEWPSVRRVDLRLSLIEEELEELKEACAEENLLGVADALADLLYVVYGAGHEFGIPLDQVFAEVHLSNMSKLGLDGKPIYRGDGKVLKGPNFREPDIPAVLRAAYAVAKARGLK